MTLDTTPSLLRRVRQAAGLAGAALIAVGAAGCEDSLLEYTDPDIVAPAEANSAGGALAMYNGTIFRFTQMTSGGGDDGTGLWVFAGLVADEFISGDTFEQRNTADQLNLLNTNTFLSGQFRTLNRVRTQARDAITNLRIYSPTPTANIGLMFGLSSYATNLAGELYCSGIPLSTVRDGEPVYAAPISTDSAFALAAALADSALLYVAGTGGFTATNLGRVAKGRALINRGRWAEAAAAVAQVPDTFRFLVGHTTNTSSNQVWSLNNNQKRYVLAEKEGGNGLPYRSAADPRLPTSGTGKAFDSQTDFFQQLVYDQFTSIPAASGIEARMIEAEAALQQDNVPTFLAKLNQARATRTGLAPLTDPGTKAGREDLLFRERAFWMFGTGHRLGDMRRLVRQYGRAGNSVYPTGAHHKSGTYGITYSIPIPFTEANNPLMTENGTFRACVPGA